MKNMILCFGIVVATLFLFGSIAIVETDSEKETALTEGVRTAIYQTMKECKDPALSNQALERYQGEGFQVREGFEVEDECLVMCFKDNLYRLLQTKDKVQIRVIDADWAEGILSVEVKQIYYNLGLKREIIAKETVIFNEQVSP